MKKTTLPLLIISTLSLPAAFAATDLAENLSLDRLDTLVVSGSRTEKSLRDVPVSLSVITQEDIQRSSAEQVGELLRDVPGVSITDTSVAGAKRVRIRGEIGSNILILIDGQEISEQRSFHGAAPLLVDASIIERIEVIKGPASVLYGSKAIGGVVNIITKKGGERAVQAEIGISYDGSTNGFGTNAQLYGSSSGFDYRVSVSRSKHGDREVPDGTNDNIAYANKDGVLENSSFDNSSVSAYLAYNMDNVTIGGRLESYQADTESHTDNSIIEDGLAAFQLDLPKRNRKKASVFFEATDVTDSLVKVKLDAFHQVRDRDFIQALDVNTPNFAGPGSNLLIDIDLTTVFEQKNAGIQGQFDFKFHPNHYLVTGFEYTHDKMKSRVVTSTRSLGTSGGFPIFDVTDNTDTTVESHQNTSAIYLQDEWSINDDVTLTAGIRQTWVDTELDKENSAVLNKLVTSEARAVGSLAVVYSGIESTAIRAGWSQGFRVPSLLELLEGTPHGGSGVLHANADLDPETSNSYEIGLRFDNKRFTFDGAVFYTKAKDYIATVNCASSNTSCAAAFGANDTQYVNVNGANTYGLEVFSAYQFPNSALSLYSNVTYLKREFEYTQFSTYKTGFPELEGRLGLEVAMSHDNIDYWGDFYLRGAVDADEVSPDSSSLTGTDEDHFAGWATLNLSVGAELGNKNPINVSLHLNNILDKDYVPSQESLIAPGRHIVVSASIKF